MARIDNLNNCFTDIANAIREKKGTTDKIPVSNFDTEIASIESGGNSIPIYCGGNIIDGLTGATSMRIPNATITEPEGSYSAFNVDTYKIKPDLVLIFGLVRGGTTYEVSDNLTVIAETDWATHTTDNLIQKLIIAKADLTSTEDYIITQPTAGRMQFGYCKFYDAGNPKIVENKVGSMTDKIITTSTVDNNLYFYVGSSIYSQGVGTTGGILQDNYTGKIIYIDHSDRLFFCWTNKKTDIIFTMKPDTPCYQFLGLKIPYAELEASS